MSAQKSNRNTRRVDAVLFTHIPPNSERPLVSASVDVDLKYRTAQRTQKQTTRAYRNQRSSPTYSKSLRRSNAADFPSTSPYCRTVIALKMLNLFRATSSHSAELLSAGRNAIIEQGKLSAKPSCRLSRRQKLRQPLSAALVQHQRTHAAEFDIANCPNLQLAEVRSLRTPKCGAPRRPPPNKARHPLCLLSFAPRGRHFPSLQDLLQSLHAGQHEQRLDGRFFLPEGDSDEGVAIKKTSLYGDSRMNFKVVYAAVLLSICSVDCFGQSIVPPSLLETEYRCFYEAKCPSESFGTTYNGGWHLDEESAKEAAMDEAAGHICPGEEEYPVLTFLSCETRSGGGESLAITTPGSEYVRSEWQVIVNFRCFGTCCHGKGFGRGQTYSEALESAKASAFASARRYCGIRFCWWATIKQRPSTRAVSSKCCCQK